MTAAPRSGWRGRLLEAALDGADALLAQLARERGDRRDPQPSGTGGGDMAVEAAPPPAPRRRISRPHCEGGARPPGEPSAAVVPAPGSEAKAGQAAQPGTPSAARDVPVGTSWAFREHRSQAALTGSVMAGPAPPRRATIAAERALLR